MFEESKPIYIQIGDLICENIILNQRGVSYYVCSGGINIAKEMKKKEFINEDVPRIIKKMKISGVTLNELNEIITKNYS